MHDYKPHRKTAEMLDVAYSLVMSVPYTVTARWLFYQLYQRGYYPGKDDYKQKFLPAVSRARRSFYEEWEPNTLADDTREIFTMGNGFSNIQSWLKTVQSGVPCRLDKWVAQPNYVQLWFEAKAMRSQFEHYTEYVTLVPLGGQPSLDLKWRLAEGLEEAELRYKKPIVILYFGDLDPAGEVIHQVVERDVRMWSAAEFEFIHCGLTLDQAREYDVPQHLEKPGQYQWEALSDEGANNIITEALKPFISHGGFSRVEALEREAEAAARDALREGLKPVIERYSNGNGG